MHIVICGSMRFASEMIGAKVLVEKLGHTCEVPDDTEEFSSGRSKIRGGRVGARRKIANDLMRSHFRKIQKAHAILVLNYSTEEKENYIGGNTFLEMGKAYDRETPIYLLNPPPDEPLINQEVEAMQPIVLGGDIDKIGRNSFFRK